MSISLVNQPSYVIDLLSWGGSGGPYSWVADRAAAIVTYSFDPDDAQLVTGSQLDSAQSLAVENALNLWTHYANVTFITTDITAPNIVFIADNLPAGTNGRTASHTNGSSTFLESNVIIDSANVGLTSAANYRTIIHEIGHALGLNHPGDDGSNPAYNRDQTTMSYNDGRYAGDGDDSIDGGGNFRFQPANDNAMNIAQQKAA